MYMAISFMIKSGKGETKLRINFCIQLNLDGVRDYGVKENGSILIWVDVMFLNSYCLVVRNEI